MTPAPSRNTRAGQLYSDLRNIAHGLPAFRFEGEMLFSVLHVVECEEDDANQRRHANECADNRMEATERGCGVRYDSYQYKCPERYPCSRR